MQEFKFLRGAAGGGEAGKVAFDFGLGAQVTQGIAEDARGQLVIGNGEAVMHPFAVAAGGDDAGFAEVGQVAGDLGLAHAKDFHEVADANLAISNEIEEAEARGVRQGAKECVKGEGGLRFRHDRIIQHIRIDIYNPQGYAHIYLHMQI